jgi:excisionase family DNA binding protein
LTLPLSPTQDTPAVLADDMNTERRSGENEPELLRVTEAAKLLALSRTKVYEMAERAEIPVVRIGSAVRIPRRRLLEWIDGHTMSADHREGG